MCLRNEVKNQRCERARIPLEYWDLSLESLQTTSPDLQYSQQIFVNLADRWKRNTRPTGQLVLLSGKPATSRVFGILLVKAALYRFDALWCSLMELSASYFSDKELFFRAMRVPVLGLYIGPDGENQGVRYLLMQLLDARSEARRFCTIYVLGMSPPEIMKRYGTHDLWQKQGSFQTIPDEELTL